MIQERLKATQSRQKSHANKKRRDIEFDVGDHVFIKVLPLKGVMRFGKTNKLSPKFVGPFEILEKIGSAAYRVALHPALSKIHNVFHISNLRKYIPDSKHVIEYEPLQIQENLSYEEIPIKILDRKEQVLRTKTIPIVKVLWRNHSTEEATWEAEEEMKQKYPNLFVDGMCTIFEDENF